MLDFDVVSIFRPLNLPFRIEENNIPVGALTYSNYTTTTDLIFTRFDPDLKLQTGVCPISRSEENIPALPATDPAYVLAPNPFAEYIRISHPGVQSETPADIVVYNPEGKVFYQNTLNTPDNRISTTQWPNGIYIVSIRQNDQTQTFKVLKTGE